VVHLCVQVREFRFKALATMPGPFLFGIVGFGFSEEIMFIRLGDKLVTRCRYNLYRAFIVVWSLIFIASLCLWNHVSSLVKIFFFGVLALTLPDSLWELGRSYESYRKEWERGSKK